MNKKKVVFITWTRADYGLLRNFLLNLNKIKEIELSLIVTWMHLSINYWYTLEDIKNDWFKTYEVFSNIDWNNLLAMSQSVGLWTIWISQKLYEINPNLVIIEGDRYEALAWAISASHQNIPIVHQWWWDIWSSIDDKIRFAISALSDYHFAWNEESYNKIISMWYDNVYNFWEPWLDDIYENNLNYNKEDLLKKYNLEEKYILSIFHPNTFEYKNIENNLKWYLEVLKELSKKYSVLVIGSNSDAWWDYINKEIMNLKNIIYIKSIPRNEFIILMKNCYFMLWNSSSAIVELPWFKKFAVNIWTRQEWRLRWNNIVDVWYNDNDILKSWFIACFVNQPL